MLKDVYARESEKADEKNKDKKIISDDAFVICEFLEKFLNSMEKARTTMLRGK